MMPKLSVIVITLNEEACIGRCLDSVSFADEIIVVDNGSTDRTREIAVDMGAKVHVTEDWPGFGVQKGRALAASTGEWVLSLDADEWVEAPLAAEIKEAIAEPRGYAGFEIPRRSRFCGRVVNHGSWSADRVLRLFRREAGRFTDYPVHEKVVLRGNLSRLSRPLEHDCVTDLGDAHRKIQMYAKASAKHMQSLGKKGSATKALLHSAWAYLNSYVIRLGILDGAVGLLVAGYCANYTYSKWTASPSVESGDKAPIRNKPAVKMN
ncbi:glycosyltransferase family 2 protein [Mesorhizobium sp. WSM4976]|uniref:glycosyltransferase family 2 protein n=1 Tax=Mesorhizobium sp. WSM4976 TaxID=3038549 RepID=UPI002415E599|nr:glycosyltransferase family 2 protein [Mesorhizobium sp. WSM4976]MDG4897529.1 glycosyltransferase family 2 protein [Mesorhizobium sp. WSM4976]